MSDKHQTKKPSTDTRKVKAVKFVVRIPQEYQDGMRKVAGKNLSLGAVARMAIEAHLEKHGARGGR